MRDLPAGTVTFLFTDLAGSTRSWEAAPEAMAHALARHDELLRNAVERHGGTVFKHMGDGICAAFANPAGAMAAAYEAWKALQTETWGKVGPLRARMAVHTGVAYVRDGDYFGQPLNRCARLMGIAHAGQVVCSSASAELVRNTVPPGFRLLAQGQHRLRDLSRPEQVFEVRFPGQDEVFPPLRSLGAFRHNLPVQRTSFVGRVGEVEEIARQVCDTPLLTLVGIGGAGKTRLALQVAADLVGRFRDGAFLVELAQCGSSAEVAEVVCQQLGVDRSGPQQPGESLVADFLADREILLVLDNCEHVLDACAMLVDSLLRRCPRLRVLATSREAIRVGGERVWPVPPLRVPAVDEESPIVLREVEAVRLFLDRAVAVSPTIALDRSNAREIAQICTMLDGIPLAIELAAARIGHLTPAQIRDHLGDRFRLLTVGPRGTPARHRTLRATLDWSYGLLEEPERVLLRRLAVFADGWTLEAATEVCAPTATDEVNALDRLGALVDRSLVVFTDADGISRYRLLETVRHYAAEKLRDAAEMELIRARHGDWFVRYAARVPLRPYGSLMRRSCSLVSERENLRAALHLCLRSGGVHAARTIGARLWGSWISLGRFDDAMQWTGQLLQHTDGATDEEYLAVLLGAAQVRIWTGDFESASQMSQRLRDAATLSGCDALLPTALFVRALASTVTMDAEPEALLGEVIERGRQLGDRSAEAEALWILGDLRIVGGAYQEGRVLIDSGLEMLTQEAPRSSPVAHCLVSRAIAAHLARDSGQAIRDSEDALSLARRLGPDSGYPTVDLVPKCTATLALALAAVGRITEARHLLRDSLHATQRTHLPLGIADCLAAVGAAAFLCGDPSAACRLLGAAGAVVAQGGAWRRISSAAIYRHYVREVRQALPTPSAAVARAEGRAMPREAALAYASAWLSNELPSEGPTPDA